MPLRLKHVAIEEHVRSRATLELKMVLRLLSLESQPLSARAAPRARGPGKMVLFKARVGSSTNWPTRRGSSKVPVVKVLLTRKLAECIDGVDLSDRHVGEVIDVPPAQARLLLAEEWAQLTEPQPLKRAYAAPEPLQHEAIDGLPLTLHISLRDREEL